MSVCLLGTVEQEIFTTGKFREIVASGGSRQENLANLGLEDLPSFKNRLKGNVKHYIFATENFREPAEIHEFR